MSCVSVLAALKSRIEATHSGLSVLDYYPTALHTTVACILVLESFNVQRSGQLLAYLYRFNARLCVAWQDNNAAESILLPYVNSIPDAVFGDMQLGGAISSGIAQPPIERSGETTFIEIGGGMYRVLDIYIEALEKSAAPAQP